MDGSNPFEWCGINMKSSPRDCQVCGATSIERYARTPDGGLWRCFGCGSRWLCPGALVDRQDPTVYGDCYRESLEAGKVSRIFQMFHRITASSQSAPHDLLDIGCGDGSFLTMARTAGWNVTGMDPDPQAIHDLRQRDIPGIVGTLGDAIPDGHAFDAITLWDVLEHVTDPERSAKWLSRAVRAGGQLVILTPDADSLFDHLALVEDRTSSGRSQKLLRLCLNRYHRFRFSREGLIHLFRRHGFAEVSVRRVQILSLKPGAYLDGFAPGMPRLTQVASVNRALSRTAFGLLRMCGIKNKLLYVGRRVCDSADGISYA